MKTETKGQARYSFNFRFTEDVKKAIKKIQTTQKIKHQNDVVASSILKVATDNISLKK